PANRSGSADGACRGRMLLRNRLNHAAHRAGACDRHFHVLDQRLVIFGQGLHRRLGLHLHHLVAAGLQAAKQDGHGLGGMLLEIVLSLIPTPPASWWRSAMLPMRSRMAASTSGGSGWQTP